MKLMKSNTLLGQLDLKKDTEEILRNERILAAERMKLCIENVTI